MAKHEQPQDETRYCERCGISFLWSIEEQHQVDSRNKPSTHLCAGCRQLLPSPGRERGLVKWYHRHKGYGFITRYNQPELYVHRTAVREGRLMTDSLVEFSIGENEQGPTARDVVVVDES